MGPRFIRPRAKELTDPAILAEYGDGDYFPLRFAVDKGEVADNGNYLERDEIAVRHGVCGDPSQVTLRGKIYVRNHLQLFTPDVSRYPNINQN